MLQTFDHILGILITLHHDLCFRYHGLAPLLFIATVGGPWLLETASLVGPLVHTITRFDIYDPGSRPQVLVLVHLLRSVLRRLPAEIDRSVIQC